MSSEERRKAIDDLYAVFAPDVVLEAEVETILARIVAIDCAATPPQPSAGLRAAWEQARTGTRWRPFPDALRHEVHGGDEHRRRDAFEEGWLAALAAKPDVEPQPVRERVDAPWNGHRAIETLRRMHAEESPALLVWECVPADIAADIVAAKPDAGEGLEALLDAIEGQNLYHGRHGTTPAGRTTAMAIAAGLRDRGFVICATTDETGYGET